MSKAPRTVAEWHRKMAADEFNYVWRLLDKKRRTREHEDDMVHASHASRFHWSHVGGPKELAIGEWQISRVYAVLARAEPALHHARRCLEICEEDGVRDFPLAYAHEALARAYAVAGDARAREKHIRLAREAGAKIAEDDDREQFFKDIRRVPRARRG